MRTQQIKMKSTAIRQSNNIYNQSLVASILEHNGKRKTKKMA